MLNNKDLYRGDPVEPGALKKASGKSRPLAEIATGGRSFWQRPFGRTLAGKNKAGKTIYSLLGGGISLVTGMNITPVTQALTTPLNQTPVPMHFTWLTIILFIVIYALGFITNYGMVKGALKKILTELRDVATEVKKAKAASSPGGPDVTDHERELILQRAETVVITLYNRIIRTWISGIFGTSFEKIPTNES